MQWFDMINFIIYKVNYSTPVQDNLKVFVQQRITGPTQK